MFRRKNSSLQMPIATWRSGQIAALRSSAHLVLHSVCLLLLMVSSLWSSHFASISDPTYAAGFSRAAALNLLYRADDVAAALSFSSASSVTRAGQVPLSASFASVLDPCQQFRGLDRQAKAAAALTHSLASASAFTLAGAANDGVGSSGCGGFFSTHNGTNRANSNLKLRAMAILKAKAGTSQSTAGSRLVSTIPAAGSQSNHSNPSHNSSAMTAGSMASVSASAVSSRSVSCSSVFSSLLPSLLPPPPGFKRFSLVDSHGKYLPLIKDYATDPRRGPLAPVLDLDAPPHCCPFNVYTQNDHERERQKEIRRSETRKVAAAAEAVEVAAEAEKARRAAKVAHVVKEALSAELQKGSLSLSPSSVKSLLVSLPSSSLLSSEATAAVELQPTIRQHSAQVRVHINTACLFLPVYLCVWLDVSALYVPLVFWSYSCLTDIRIHLI